MEIWPAKQYDSLRNREMQLFVSVEITVFQFPPYPRFPPSNPGDKKFNWRLVIPTFLKFG